MLRLFKRKETDEQFVIRWADELIKTSPHTGVLDKYCFNFTWNARDSEKGHTNPNYLVSIDRFRQKAIATIPEGSNNSNNISEVVGKLESYLNKVKNFLLNHGYILDPYSGMNWEWKLSDKGNLVKELGGHNQYVKYRRREINILKRQHHINIGLISVGLIAAAMPFVVALVFPPKIIVQSLPSPVIIHSDTVRLHQPFVDTAIKTQSIPQQPAETKQSRTKQEAQ